MRTLQEAVDEVDRELQVRERCFGRWVKEGKLSSSDAKDRFERLAAAKRFLAEQLLATDMPSPVAENEPLGIKTGEQPY